MARGKSSIAAWLGRIALRWIRRLVLAVMALVVVFLYFMLLPILQTIGNPPKKQFEVRSVGVADEPPPPPPEIQEPEEEEEESNPEPKLDQSDQLLDLSQLELALNPGMTGDWGGDFSINVADKVHTPQDTPDDYAAMDLDEKPRAVYRPNPRYPTELQGQGIGGTVMLVFMVDAAGQVQNIKTQKSVHPALDRAAVEAVSRWRFKPGTRKGEPVPYRMRIPITFSAE